ncbi:MAG: hypothetical protein JXB07_13550 [Anaerolineae bacterium]|nr:hypothetical protein [Anaerolineae bacterium]
MRAKQQKITWAITNRICFIICLGITLTACGHVAQLKPTAQSTNGPVTLGVDEKTVNLEVFVFEDTNLNGRHDGGERPLPGVLIGSRSNIHGNSKRVIKHTSEDGKATFDVTFTHFFDIQAVPLCGYTPTTPTVLDASSTKYISFGQAPDQPREGESLVRFFFWVDANQDGRQDENEMPLSDFSLRITLDDDEFARRSLRDDDLAVTTGETGWGEINLGNTCGRLTVWTESFNPWSFWKVTSIDPEPVIAVQDGPFEDSLWYYGFDYDLGETIIKIGLAEHATE